MKLTANLMKQKLIYSCLWQLTKKKGGKGKGRLYNIQGQTHQLHIHLDNRGILTTVFDEPPSECESTFVHRQIRPNTMKLYRHYDEIWALAN